MNVQLQRALEEAVESGDLLRARGLLEQGADPNGEQHAIGDAPIFELAFHHEGGQMLRLLAEHGATVTARDRSGRPRLAREAGASDASATLEWLLDLGANPNEVDQSEWTALHWAAAFGYLENVRVLLSAGASPLRVTAEGLTPSDLAARNDHAQVARILAAPEDRPDVIHIGRHVIAIGYEDDPRYAEETAAWKVARARAASMHSPDELLTGLLDGDWRVRAEVIPRLKVRGKDDPRTVPALIKALLKDPMPTVRGDAAGALAWIEQPEVVEALLAAEDDPDPEVREDVQVALNCHGLRPLPDGYL